jgi:DNA-directed RNA polymerase subunit RPC12/RpoP
LLASLKETDERIHGNKEEAMTTPRHCPGFEDFKHLKAFICKCSNCGKEKEIFSDEFDQKHVCPECGKEIDFTKCAIEAEGGTTA